MKLEVCLQSNSACAKLGVHYVDMTAEPAWIQYVIDQCVSLYSMSFMYLSNILSLRYDYNAYKTGAIIVPSCGLESVPSDLCVYIAYKKLRELEGPGVQLEKSVTMDHIGSNMTGGTARTMITMPEVTPKEVLLTAFTPYALSPGIFEYLSTTSVTPLIPFIDSEERAVPNLLLSQILSASICQNGLVRLLSLFFHPQHCSRSTYLGTYAKPEGVRHLIWTGLRI